MTKWLRLGVKEIDTYPHFKEGTSFPVNTLGYTRFITRVSDPGSFRSFLQSTGVMDIGKM